MATPLPSPRDRSSATRATDKTNIRRLEPERSTQDQEPVDEPPTVINQLRPKSAFDNNLAESLIGKRLGHFEVIEGVGVGGMAAVLKARDLDLGRIVALKILPPDMADDPENIVRFKHEARAAARLDHENIARVYHCGEDQGLHFIAFEFVEGDNLRQRMEANGGTIGFEESIALMLQLSAGLAHAAERGVVHRDIKPSNIIVTPDGRAKIVDMGLARSLDARHAGHLTHSGMTLGTFDYISPEQAIDPRVADVRSDIYSLGCTFYHALTGHVPVPDGTAAAKLEAQKNLLPADPRVYVPDLPPDLAAILGRMMAKSPDRRYQHPDHLAAHLRGLARKLNVSTGPAAIPIGASTEDPLPPPPRLSAAWVGTALVIMALAVVIFANSMSGPPPSLPDWPENKSVATNNPELIEAGPIASRPSTEVRIAADVAELAMLLRQGATNIRLTGAEYNLFTYRDLDGQPVDFTLTGDDLRLEGVNNPIVRLSHAPEARVRPKSLTLRGTGTGNAQVRGIQFVFPSPDAGNDDVGVLAIGQSRIQFEDCSFTPSSPLTRSAPAALGLELDGTDVDVRRCYFAPGGAGIDTQGSGKLTLEHCALGPLQAGVRVGKGPGASDVELTLRHCSTLFTGGSVVEIENGASCVVQAGHCLFTGPVRYGPAAAFEPVPVVVRQIGARAKETRYEPAGGARPMPNAYHHVLAYAGTDRALSFAECAEKNIPVRDTETSMRHPWEARDPFTFLEAQPGRPAEPKKAFAPDRNLQELRVPNDRDGLTFGARFIGAEPLYPVPLSPPARDVLEANIKVWDPTATLTTPSAGVYPTLAMALAAAKRGDTVLVRHTGSIEVEPVELKKEDTLLTIKPYPGSRPVLVPARSGLKREPGLIKLYGGTLILDGLQFRLPGDRPPAVVVIPGGAQVELRNSVVTFEEGDDLAAVVISDPRNEMMMMGATPDRWPTPRILVESTTLRGKGRLLTVKSSRPFELDVKNSLAALDESLIEVEPSSVDPSMAGPGNVRLNRVTAYLSESLLRLKAGERKGESIGLTKTEVTATQCLFVPAKDAREAFVRVDRFDSVEQVQRWMNWTARGTVYGHDKKKTMLDIRPTQAEDTPATTIEGDRWLELTREEGDPFATEVLFRLKPPDAGQVRKFLGVQPRDFMVLSLRTTEGTTATPVGASADLPVPFEE